MTLNILFLSINIKKRKFTLEEALHEERVEELYEENKDRQISIHYFM
ncbi:YrzI family small protein [Neobacillus sp. FSL H8-0543]